MLKKFNRRQEKENRNETIGKTGNKTIMLDLNPTILIIVLKQLPQYAN
jgi:hypothetical protein